MKDDISIVLCGEAGQGIQTVETLLVKIFKTSGFNVFAVKEYMSRIRGGSNSTEIRVSSKPVSSYVERIDLLIPLGKDAISHLRKRISEQTKVISDIKDNISAIGLICAAFGIDKQIAEDNIKNYFQAKGEKVVADNLASLNTGYSQADFRYEIGRDAKISGQILISGAEALSLGAIAGGCNFIAAYPMTPSTGVFTFLSRHAKELGIISEQAEDEISAMNMALGAWYAGARALVNTSGGGFDLMTEGLSLAGMIESPVVINLAQRPGPSTGLPTRTAQGDLELALYSGHGEFPRIILIPGNLDDAFYLAQKAFDLADKYQVPVFLMTDQYLADSYYNIDAFDLSGIKVEHHFVETSNDYKRYQLTPNGISPRGIPQYGNGLVCVDSDEHDESGHITEDLDLSSKMADKRLGKIREIEKEIIPPELIGSKNYKTIIVGWGTTYSAIREALDNLKRDDIAFLYFRQVYPLHGKTLEYLKKAEKKIIVENNSTSQFGKLVKQVFGIDFDKKILKYNGMPFSVEELMDEFKKL